MNKIETKRINWIDTLRGIAMFLVVWGHAFPTNKWKIRKYIYSFHMPIFFFISGLTFKNSDKIPFKDFFKKKFKELIIPYLALNIICYLIMMILYNFDILENFDYLSDIIGIFYSQNEVFFLPSAPSWFLITLFLTELLFYFLKKNSTNDFNLGLSIIVCGIISYTNSISKYQVFMPLHFDTVFMGVVFYYLGYLFMKNIETIKKFFNSKIKMFIYGGCLGMIGLIAQYFNRRVSMHANLYGSISLFLISSLCTIMALILFVWLFMNKSKLFKSVGQNTIFYLGYHSIIISVVFHFYSVIFKTNYGILLFSILLTILMYPFSILIKKFAPIIIGKVNIKSLN